MTSEAPNQLRQPVTPEVQADFEQRMGDYTFFHRYEIRSGVFTPGSLTIDPADVLNRNGYPENLEGLRAMDIGCMEGAIAFELERRGASSVAMDIHNPDEVAFNLCKEIVESDVQFVEDTVYSLPELFDKASFDLIVFRGVLYHLKHPLAALEAISYVLKPGGTLQISGECLVNEMFDLRGERFDAGAVSQSDISDVPLAACYPGQIEGVPSSIWFVPNLACVRSWLSATGFEVEALSATAYSGARIKVSGAQRALQRFEGVARRTSAEPVIEHPIWHWSNQSKK